jgi:hypothetical protein
MTQEELIARIGEVWEAVGQVLEISRQVLEAIERTEDRLARSSAEMVRIGTLAGRPVHLERSEDGSTALFIGHIGVDIGNDVYVRLRSLAFD